MQKDVQQAATEMSVTDVVYDAMQMVSTYASGTDDWLVIKRELLVLLPVEERQRFSRRHPITKQQTTNEYEDILIDIWFELTGVRLMIHE